MKVYGDIKSGNCYKVALTLNLLEIKHDWITIDLMKRENQSHDFLAKNPQGKIPILELDDGRVLKESNAIINYLARDSHLVGDDDFSKAQVQQWQFFEQYSHEPYLAVARFIKLYLGLPEKLEAKYQSTIKPGYLALDLLERELINKKFLVDEKLTVADISLYPYTRLAHQGGFNLSDYPNINNWFKRIEATQNYLSIV